MRYLNRRFHKMCWCLCKIYESYAEISISKAFISWLTYECKFYAGLETLSSVSSLGVCFTKWPADCSISLTNVMHFWVKEHTYWKIMRARLHCVLCNLAVSPHVSFHWQRNWLYFDNEPLLFFAKTCTDEQCKQGFSWAFRRTRPLHVAVWNMSPHSPALQSHYLFPHTSTVFQTHLLPAAVEIYIKAGKEERKRVTVARNEPAKACAALYLALSFNWTHVKGESYAIHNTLHEIFHALPWQQF